MQTVDLKLGASFDREDAELFLDWFPEGATSNALDILALGTGIDRDELPEVLERVARKRDKLTESGSGTNSKRKRGKKYVIKVKLSSRSVEPLQSYDPPKSPSR